jgi:hypothetical protein
LIAMDKGDGTRFDRLGAFSQGHPGLLDRHTTHGNIRHRDVREDALRVRGADGQEHHGYHQPEERRHTGGGKPESAQRRRRERWEAHFARSR